MAAPLSQLATSALVGLTRKPPAWPSAPGGIGELLASLEGTETELRFLRTAGIIALAAEAGYEPVAVGNALPAAPPEECPAADTPRLRTALTLLLTSGPVEILIELLDLLTERKITVPPEFLPALLAASTHKPALRHAIARMPGQRHRWLASLNADWQAILTEAITSEVSLSEQLWTDGSMPERIAILHRIRRSEPARARDLLAAALPKEPAKERLEMLSVMTGMLSADDESFLNTTLADKSKGVRQCAAELLSCLPQSSFAQRMTLRLAAILTVEKKLLRAAKLEVALPEKFDPAWARDAIEEKPLQGEGARAYWLRQMTGFSPLSWWTSHFNLTPPEILSLLEKSDWAAPLVSGLAAATLTQRDASWAAALIGHGPFDKVYLDFAAIASVAGTPATEKWLTRLSSTGEFLPALTHAVKLDQWSESLADTMLAGVMRVAAKEPDYTFYTHLPSVALRLPVSRLAAAGEGWHLLMDKPYLRTALDSFLQNVQLRKAIHEELSTLSS